MNGESLVSLPTTINGPHATPAATGPARSTLARVADEILMRTAVIEPRLKDTLYAAPRTFERIEAAEDIAQVALSCRRSLEGLADALYPPRSEPVNGRDVGPNAYRNRLWAYAAAQIGQSEQNVLVAQLEDLGKHDRIDAFDE